MITGIYCIKDTKSTFWKPHVQINDQCAQREFDNMINSAHNEFCNVNYADLELWCLGTYDDANGAIVSEVRYVCSGIDVKKVND